MREAVESVVREQPEPVRPAPRDEVEQAIDDDGYVWQARLWRRYVMAQMFRLLHGKCGLPMSEENYDMCVNRRGANYPWRMVKDEMHAQELLWLSDKEQFAERNRWFNKSVLEAMARDTNEGFGARLLEKLAGADTPAALCQALRSVGCCEGNKKSAAWKSAYKGAGAYFTMKNLILFHNCQMHLDTGEVLDRDASFSHLRELNNNPAMTGEKMFGVMLKLIVDNNFDWRR